MTTVAFANVTGAPRGTPVQLPPRRRRLSTVAKRHAPPGRKFIVSVHRKGELSYIPTDHTVRMRNTWAKTLIGPHDFVLITLLPLGGGGRSGGMGKAGIGLSIAAIALAALAPFAAPALAGGLAALGMTVSAGALQAGMVIGAVGLSLAAQLTRSNQKKDRKQDVFSIAGGGNVPRPGDRKPLIYGKTWTTPPLSQPDYTIYNGPQMALVKRMTLGIGKFAVHTIRVGDAVLWTSAGGIQAPFNQAGADLTSAAVEILFEQPSTITPGDVITQDDVAGQELPRPGGNPEWTPWFRASPLGVGIDQVQIDYQFPSGITRVSSQGRQVAGVGGIIFQYRYLDPVTGVPNTGTLDLLLPDLVVNQTTGLRYTNIVTLPAHGNIEVRAQNKYAEATGFVQENRATWDGLRGIVDDVRIREKTTEIVIRVPAGKGLTITAFSDVQVEATRIIPVWNGTAFVEQPERKAVHAFVDLVRAEYGLNQPNGADVEKALYYAEEFDEHDQFNGALPSVASFWEAAAEVLQPFRADPVKVGAVHTFVRDESRGENRHVLTRRQIIRDSGQASFRFAQDEGDGGDVIVEFDRDGDPKRPDEVRWSYGPATRTPKRFRVNGLTDAGHALRYAKWLGAVAIFRGATRKVTTEWDGRLIYPGDHILSDLWFLKGKGVTGLVDYDPGNGIVATDCDMPALGDCYASIRSRTGREWGIVRAVVHGPRVLGLNGIDIAALTASTGKSIGQVLASDSQDPTTITIGELVELQETYVAKSAIPVDQDHVQIEMVLDDTRIWQILDETIIVPGPVNPNALAEPLIPTITVLHARCANIETGIEVRWSISPARGARTYEVRMSYDAGDTWEPLSSGPETSGRKTMLQSDDPVTVGARAYGRTGLPGEWIYVTFTTVSPVIDAALLGDLDLGDILQARFDEVVAAINDINAIGEDNLNQGKTLLRNELKKLNDQIQQLAAADATVNASSYEHAEYVKVAAAGKTQEVFAALKDETQARITDTEAAISTATTLAARIGAGEAALTNESAVRAAADSAQASQTTTLVSRVGTAESGIVAQAAATNALTTTVSNVDGKVNAVSSRTTTLESTVNDPFLGVGATASAAQVLSTAVFSAGGRVGAIASDVTSLKAEVNGPNGRVQGAINQVAVVDVDLGKVELKWGVGFEANGQARGGIALTRIVRNNGAEEITTFGIDGDAVITGTMDANKIKANSITAGQLSSTTLITDDAQIGSATIGTLKVKDGAITHTASSSSGTVSTQVALNVRGNAPVTIIAVYAGAPFNIATPGPAADPGQVQVYRNGNLLMATNGGYDISGSGAQANISFMPTTLAGVDYPGAGGHVYYVQTTNTRGLGGVTIICMEHAR